ncbi:MAG: type II toxin-antitoxin system RelB/DinJ family antitoxin [Clostridia bacterium]|nr:type II toxin-antitoxin system RelB/DinJ family antitoxin [Clostridia bacterium]
MSQTLITIRMDEQVKRNFEYVCNELGLNMSTAINIFAKKVCRDQGIPFDISMKSNNENYKTKESSTMTNSPKFTVYLYPEIQPENRDLLSVVAYNKTFSDFEEAFDFLVNKSTELQNTYENSQDINLSKSCVFFDIIITDLRSHKYIIQFGLEGLMYTKDDSESFSLDDQGKAFDEGDEHESDTEDDILYKIVYSFIRGLLE